MALSSAAQGLFKAQALALIFAASGLMLSGCGGGRADTAKSQSVVSEQPSSPGGETSSDQPAPQPRSLSLGSQPANTTIYEGQSTTFSLTVAHTDPITISWYKDGSKISGANGTSYTVSTATTAKAGTYSCAVTDGVLTVNCDNFNLAVNQIVQITQQPTNQMVSEGVDVTFNVTATGTGPLSYQWYFNSQAMNGKTTAQLALNDVTMAKSGTYYCIVSNPGSHVTSSSASLSVAAQAVTGSALITWTAPTKRANGNNLAANEIAGYQLYYSATANGQLTPLTSLTANELSVRVDDLLAGAHYFALTTKDSSGLESEQSARFSVTIN